MTALIGTLNRREVFGALPAMLNGPRRRPEGYRDVRAFGARGDGLTDDTMALQAAHASGQPLWYPRASKFYRISSAILVIADVLGDQAVLRCRQDGSHQKSIFLVKDNATPISIRGMILDGEYLSGSAGEWSASISLIGARRVTIAGNMLVRPYGDCVYLGTSEGRTGCASVLISRNFLIEPRRCCIALVCGMDIVIDSNHMAKHTQYVTAVDLEPNDNGFDRVERITVRDNYVDTVTSFVRVDNANSKSPASQIIIRGNHGRSGSPTVHLRGEVQNLVNRENTITPIKGKVFPNLQNK